MLFKIKDGASFDASFTQKSENRLDELEDRIRKTEQKQSRIEKRITRYIFLSVACTIVISLVRVLVWPF